jgi:hypothetical protein
MPRRSYPRQDAEASALQDLDTPIFWQTKGAAKLDETQLLPIVPPPALLNADQFPRESEHAHGGPGVPRMLGSVDARGLIKSPNFSSRGGKKVRLLIVHTAEGSTSVEGLGAYFANAANQVSSHAGIDDHRIETYVPYDQAAWTCRSANAIADQVELCGFARWTRVQWMSEHPEMLLLTAQWLRERAAARGIPLRKLTPAQVAAGDSGVIAHVDWTVGMKDGTHTDAGNGFPWDYVMAVATGGSAPTPPTPKPEPMQTPTHVLAWTLPAGDNMQETIPVPVFPPYALDQHAELWMTTGWENAHIDSMYYIRDRGPELSPEQENWGGTGEWTLVHDDRPGFDLGPDCTSVAISYSSPRPIQCLIRYP